MPIYKFINKVSPAFHKGTPNTHTHSLQMSCALKAHYKSVIRNFITCAVDPQRTHLGVYQMQ